MKNDWKTIKCIKETLYVKKLFVCWTVLKFPVFNGIYINRYTSTPNLLRLHGAMSGYVPSGSIWHLFVLGGSPVETCRNMSKHVELASLICISFASFPTYLQIQKKKGRSCLERTMNTTSPDLIPELPPRLIAASTDTDVKLEARVSTTKTRANNPTNQTCACKGTSRAQEWEEPFLLSTCGLVWSGLICIRLHLHQIRLSYKASAVLQPYPVKWRLPSLQTWKRPMPPT